MTLLPSSCTEFQIIIFYNAPPCLFFFLTSQKVKLFLDRSLYILKLFIEVYLLERAQVNVLKELMTDKDKTNK